jgi:IS30 family transposase
MSYKQLTLRERYEIKAYMQAGISKSRIAEFIGVHKGTIYREVDRNKGSMGYDPELAQKKADARREGARKHIRFTDKVKERVEELLRLDFSPEQISGYLEKKEGIRISHETIYQHVYADQRAGGDLYTHLRWSRKKRRKRLGKKDRRGQIPDRVSIDERPEIVDAKERIGDWEVDTMIGKNHKGVLVTAVERKAKYSCIGHAPNRTSELVTKALIDMLCPYQDKVLTITIDNGKEFSMHKQIAKALKTDVYFAHPYRAWERGLNENTNGLIRQYFPKKTTFENLKEQDIKFVEQRLNNRPRKSLEFKTPAQCFL